MTTRQESTVVTCDASVVTTNPTMVQLPFPGGILHVVRIVIPDGHAGLTGIALGFGNTPIIPITPGQFYSGNDRIVTIDYVDNVPGTNWQAFMCNLDTIPHSWEVDMDFDEVDVTNTSSLISPVSGTAIIAAGTAAMNGQ